MRYNTHKYKHKQTEDPPTGPASIQEQQDWEIGEFYIAPECRTTEFEAPKLGISRSGSITCACVRAHVFIARNKHKYQESFI